jgi:hypothetical protein
MNGLYKEKMEKREMKINLDHLLDELLGGLVISIAIVTIGIVVNILSEQLPLLAHLWNNIVDVFYQQPLVAISTLVVLLSVSLSLVTTILQVRGARTLRSAAEEVISQKGAYSLEPPAKPLKVFISSTMADLAEERQVVKDALNQFPMVEPVLFEEFGAPIASPREMSLGVLKDADIFVLILGMRYSPLVEEEYRAAVQLGKPILVFVKKGAWEPSKEMQTFLTKIPLTWAVFSSNEDLRRQVQLSIADILINAYRRLKEPTGMVLKERAS